MGILYGDSPLVGFRYEVNIIPDMGVNKSDFKDKESFNNKLKTPEVIGGLISSSVSAVDKASFSEISGVSVALETEPVYNIGGDVVNKPKNTIYSPLVLKRGLTGTQSQLMVWVAATLFPENKSNKEKLIIKKTVIVNLLNDQGAPIMCWVFNGAFPTKWSMSGLKAMSNEIVIEELELRYENFYPMILGI